MKSEYILMAKRIKELRKQKKLSQEELGDIIGVTKVSICGYEKATRLPSLDTLNILVDALGTTTDYLLGREIKTKENKFISSEDVEIIKNIKQNKRLYRALLRNDKRLIMLIAKKMEKYI